MNYKSVSFGYILAILSAAFFGSVSTMAKPTLSTVNPLFLTCLVYLISAASITPAALHQKTIFQRKDFLFVIPLALSGAVIAPALYFTGLHLTSASNTAVLSNVEIVFTVLLAILIFKEKATRIGYLGLVLVSVGALIVATDLQFSKSIFDLDLGNLLIIGSAAFWALDNNMSKAIAKRIDVLKITQLKSAIGGSILLTVVLLLKIPLAIEPKEVPFVLLLGTIGFAASLYCFLHAMNLIGIVKTIVIFATSSVFGLIFATSFLHENISVYQLVAIAIMILGIYLTSKKGQIETRVIPP